jgi:hypothetical protein
MRGTIDDRLHKLFRVVYFILLPSEDLTCLWVLFFPVCFQIPSTATRPGTILEWAMYRMWEIRFEVSVPFLCAGELFSANRAFWWDRGRGFIGLNIDVVLEWRWRDRP